MENKILVKDGYSKKYGSWTAKTDQTDYYIQFDFGSSTTTATTLYKITKEIFNNLDDKNLESIENVVEKGEKIHYFCTGVWTFGEIKENYVPDWKEQLDKFKNMNYYINLEIMLESLGKNYGFTKQNEIFKIFKEPYKYTITYYANILYFCGKDYYVFTYSSPSAVCSFPIYKEEYDNLINTSQTSESIEIFKERIEKRYIYDNEYSYAEAEEDDTRFDSAKEFNFFNLKNGIIHTELGDITKDFCSIGTAFENHPYLSKKIPILKKPWNITISTGHWFSGKANPGKYITLQPICEDTESWKYCTDFLKYYIPDFEFDDKEKECKNFEWGIIYIETIQDIHIGSGSFIIIKFNGDIQAWNKK